MPEPGTTHFREPMLGRVARALFDDETPADGRTTPHLALFIAFLRLFELGQADLNLFTGRHLEIY